HVHEVEGQQHSENHLLSGIKVRHQLDEFFVLSPRSCYRFYRRWHAWNFNDQYIALGPIGLSDEAQRDAKLAKLDSVAVQRGTRRRRCARDTAAVELLGMPKRTRPGRSFCYCIGSFAPATRMADR